MRILASLVTLIVLCTLSFSGATQQISANSNWASRLSPSPQDSLWTIKRGVFKARPIVMAGVGVFDHQERNFGFLGAVGGEFRVDHGKTGLGVQVYLQNTAHPDFKSSATVIPTVGAPSVTDPDGFTNVLIPRVDWSYTPWEVLKLNVAYGRQHWGSGMRSLWLSDATGNYPYVLLTTDVWKLELKSMYAVFNQTIPPQQRLGLHSSAEKFGSFHQLSWNAYKGLSFSLFEAIIWANEENRRFDVNYLNPIAFYRPVEFSIGSTDNALFGLSGDWAFENGLTLYGQLVLDEFLMAHLRDRTGWWANKYGVQSGLQWEEVFGWTGIDLQGELNWVRPYTYSHAVPTQNYSHVGQSLAHPLGANFSEVIGGVVIDRLNWHGLIKAGFVQTGLDTGGINFGQNVMLSNDVHYQEFENTIGQGERLNFAHVRVDIAYDVASKHGIQVFGQGRIWRSKRVIESDGNAYYFQVGMRAFVPRIEMDVY